MFVGRERAIERESGRGEISNLYEIDSSRDNKHYLSSKIPCTFVKNTIEKEEISVECMLQGFMN